MADQKLCKAKVIFVLGGPGSGKGTQCEKLVKEFGFNHLSTGDLLRAEVESGSPRGKELKAKMESGELISLDIVLQLLKDAMIKCVDKNCNFLIDGYPRELEQATKFEADICACQCVLCFDVEKEVMVARLLKRGETSGRVDDNEATIRKRLDTFDNLTRPVIDHYSKKNKLIKIDAAGGIDPIYAKVKTELAKHGVK